MRDNSPMGKKRGRDRLGILHYKIERHEKREAGEDTFRKPLRPAQKAL